MFSRNRAILRILENEGGAASRLRLVKLAFVLSRSAAAPRSGVYEFVPYKHGPFSFTLFYDIRSLAENGWLLEAESNVKIKQAPQLEVAFLEPSFQDLIDEVSMRYKGIDTRSLVDSVYRDYPWFTVNAEAVQKRAVQRPVGKPGVYTVGYEGISVDGLLDLLLREGIQRLIDVRRNPIARRYGFHKSTLKRLCEDLALEYVHVPSLGVPSAWRADLEDQSSYERLFERYEREILPREGAAIDRVAQLVAGTASALMCMEADHHRCHRSRLGIVVSRLTSLPLKELR